MSLLPLFLESLELLALPLEPLHLEPEGLDAVLFPPLCLAMQFFEPSTLFGQVGPLLLDRLPLRGESCCHLFALAFGDPQPILDPGLLVLQCLPLRRQARRDLVTLFLRGPQLFFEPRLLVLYRLELSGECGSFLALVFVVGASTRTVVPGWCRDDRDRRLHIRFRRDVGGGNRRRLGLCARFPGCWLVPDVTLRHLLSSTCRPGRTGQGHALRPDAQVLLHRRPELGYPGGSGAGSGSGHCNLAADEVHCLESGPHGRHFLQAAIGEVHRLVGDEGDLFTIGLYLEGRRDESSCLHVEQRPPTERLFALQDHLCLSPLDQEGGRNPRVV